MSKSYCYLHMRPDKFGLDSVFYVGKGTEKRIRSVHRKHNSHHTRIVNKVGKENVRVVSFPCISEDAAFELEKVLIKAFRDAGIQLCNCTDGGEGASGYVHTDATRAKMSAANLGVRPTDETKAKLSAAAMGNKRWLGVRHTEETKAKISAAAMGNKNCLGVRCTEETKAKLSAANQLVQRKASPRKDNKSGHKGVDWDRKSSRWRVRITVDRRTIWLGSFATLEEAVLVRKQGELKYWK